MVLTNPTTPTAQERADQLLAECETIRRYVELMNTLQARVLAYEEQFGIPSSDVDEAIESGQLQETLEVTNWLLDIYLLSRAKTVG